MSLRIPASRLSYHTIKKNYITVGIGTAFWTALDSTRITTSVIASLTTNVLIASRWSVGRPRRLVVLERKALTSRWDGGGDSHSSHDDTPQVSPRATFSRSEVGEDLYQQDWLPKNKCVVHDMLSCLGLLQALPISTPRIAERSIQTCHQSLQSL